MAIIAHWVVAFMLAPLTQLPASFLCELTMVSDVLAGLLIDLKIEQAVLCADFTGPEILAEDVLKIQLWKKAGQWDDVQDRACSNAASPRLTGVLPIIAGTV